MKRAFQIISVTFIFILCIYVYEYRIGLVPLGEPFELIDSHGKKITQDDLRKKPAVIYFGYTMCPDICPTTLFDLEQVLKALGSRAERIGVWFFTVDPERDTPEVMHDYLSNFSDKIIGITGEPNKVHATIKSFKIIAEKVTDSSNDNYYYTYDHTAAIILLDKGGRVIGKIPYQEDPKIILEQLRDLTERADK